MSNSKADTQLQRYLTVVSRRRVIVAAVFLGVVTASVLYTTMRAPTYRASSQVFLSRQNVASALTGTQDANLVYGQAERVAETQSRLARSRAVAERVIRAERLTLDLSELLQSVEVAIVPNTDLLEISVTRRSAAEAEQLAKAYAEEFSKFRGQLDAAPLSRAREELETRLKAARASEDTRLVQTLMEKEQQLRTLQTLQTSQAFVVPDPVEAEQVSPQPLRESVLGAVLGFVLAIGLAFVRDLFDTRVRSASEIENGVGRPLLGRLQHPPDEFTDGGVLMLARPSSPQAEGYRNLRVNIDLATGAGKLGLLVTSALPSEGKTTTTANLAVAFASVGRSVALVDLDLRKPKLNKLFAAPARPGLTEVISGEANLEEAVLELTPGHDVGTNPSPITGGVIRVLPSGRIPASPGDFVNSTSVVSLIHHLQRHHDVVLVDAPPLFNLGDAIALADFVGSVLVVSNLERLRRPHLAELRRILDSVRASVLGFAVTAAGLDETFTYSAYEYDAPSATRSEPAPTA